MTCKCHRPSAPFLEYKKNDSQAYQDGVESARSWRAHWNHRPGGPYYVEDNKLNPNCPAWCDYVETTQRHNFLYRLGWEVEMTKLNPSFIESLGKPMTDVSNAIAANPLLALVA